MAATRRVTRADPAKFAIVVDAKHEAAAQLHQHLGFRRLGSRPMSLFTPVSTVLEAVEQQK